MTRKVAAIRDAWWEHVETAYQQAEEDCRGVLLNRRRAGEFDQLYGVAAVKDVLFNGGPAAHAYYFASEELVRWWETHERLTWAEFAYQAGIQDRRTTATARKAPGARADAARCAWQQLSGRR